MPVNELLMIGTDFFCWLPHTQQWYQLPPQEQPYFPHSLAVVKSYLHNLKDDVRQSLYDECNYWMKAVQKKNTPFLGGKQPNLGDLAVYGVLSSIEGCDAFQDLLENTKIGNWYWPMKQLVQSNTGVVIT
ncbi:hypothetical protein J6590_018930 [Homalodisca vitripennis]|nr:hypothetical protein J6590_018930 [Homalodisca vitripennis]